MKSFKLRRLGWILSAPLVVGILIGCSTSPSQFAAAPSSVPQNIAATPALATSSPATLLMSPTQVSEITTRETTPTPLPPTPEPILEPIPADVSEPAPQTETPSPTQTLITLTEQPDVAETPTQTLIPPTPVPSTAAPFPVPERIVSKVTDLSFDDITVSVGSTITWEFLDGLPHTATAGTPPRNKSGEFDSGLVRADASYSLTFTEPGVIPYFCTLHPIQMIGTITVLEAN